MSNVNHGAERRHRRWLRTLAPILAVLVLAAACTEDEPSLDDLDGTANGDDDADATDDASEDEPSDEADDEAAAVDGDTVTLEMWDWWVDADPNAELFQGFVDRFNDEHPNIEVTRSSMPYGEYEDAVIQAALAGELPDLLTSDVVVTAAWAPLGVFRDLTDEVAAWGMRDNYYEGRFSSVVGADGGIYSIPNSSNTLGLYYNEEMLDAAGVEPPTDWDQLMSAAEAIVDNGDEAIIVSADPSLTGYQWLPWLWQAGGAVERVDDESGRRAITIWRDLIDMGAMTPDVVTYSHDDLREQFMAGQVAMMVNGPWNLGALSEDDVEIEWAAVPLPCDAECASQAGGENIGIGAGSDEPEAAWTFIEWLQSDEIALEWTLNRNGIPHRLDHEDDPVFTEGRPQMQAFLDQAAYMRTPPAEYATSWPQVQEALSDAIHGVLVGNADPEAAVAEAADIIADLREDG